MSVETTEGEELQEILEDAISILNADQDITLKYLMAEEVPDTKSILTDQNLTTYEYHEIPLRSEVLEEVRENAAKDAESFYSSVNSGDRELVKYDVTNTNQDIVPSQYINKEDLTYPQRFERLFDADSFGYTTYDETENIGFQVLRITSERTGDQVLAFQRFTGHQLSSDGEKLRLMKEEEQYSQFDKTVVTVRNRFDCIWYQNQIFVFRTKPFEDIFDFLEQYKQHANNVINGLEDADLTIHNEDEFVDSIQGDRRALRKMHSVEQQGIYDTIDRGDVEDVIDEFDLGIEATTEDGQWGITVPDLRKKWDVIRLLNDDHVVSYLIDAQYQVYEKDKR